MNFVFNHFFLKRLRDTCIFYDCKYYFSFAENNYYKQAANVKTLKTVILS